eukprot:14868548-Alexandrium_andersonii.AAC.1
MAAVVVAVMVAVGDGCGDGCEPVAACLGPTTFARPRPALAHGVVHRLFGLAPNGGCRCSAP